MKNNNAWLVGLVIVLILINVVGFYYAAQDSVDEEALVKNVAAKVALQIPSASDIAAEIEIPEIVVPEAKEVNSERIDDLWRDLYSDEIEELEAEAYDVAEEEFEDNDYELLEDWLKANIEGFDALEDVDIDEDSVDVISLGLEEDEDKVAEVVFELDLEYSLEEGPAQDYKKKVIATGLVSFEEGDFDEENVEFVFA